MFRSFVLVVCFFFDLFLLLCENEHGYRPPRVYTSPVLYSIALRVMLSHDLCPESVLRTLLFVSHNKSVENKVHKKKREGKIKSGNNRAYLRFFVNAQSICLISDCKGFCIGGTYAPIVLRMKTNIKRAYLSMTCLFYIPLIISYHYRKTRQTVIHGCFQICIM